MRIKNTFFVSLKFLFDLLAPSIHEDPALHGLFSHVICFKISHCGPSYSSGHEQVYDANKSVQFPPLWQGLLAHSSISNKKNSLKTYMYNVYRNEHILSY